MPKSGGKLIPHPDMCYHAFHAIRCVSEKRVVCGFKLKG